MVQIESKRIIGQNEAVMRTTNVVASSAIAAGSAAVVVSSITGASSSGGGIGNWGLGIFNPAAFWSYLEVL